MSMIEKVVDYDQQGRITRVQQRDLPPVEEFAELAYRGIEAESRRPELHGAEWLVVTVSASASVDFDRVSDLLAQRLAADLDLWTRTGWKGVTLKMSPGQRVEELARLAEGSAPADVVAGVDDAA